MGFALGKKERPGAMPSGQTKEKEQMACVGKAGRRQLRPRKEEVGQVRCVSRPRRERVREWIRATLWASTRVEEEAGQVSAWPRDFRPLLAFIIFINRIKFEKST